jgi:predicted deacetylase
MTDSTHRILVCVHDVTPRHDERLRAIDAFLREVGVGARYSMLVVPDFWGGAPLDSHPGFVEWLRAREADGVEMALHGFTHRDTSEHAGTLASFKASTLTAREGEFLGLSREEAARRLDAGREVLGRVLRREVDGFVAPAWLYSEGARAALADRGFTWAEDHFRVWRPAERQRDEQVVLRGPVVSYASRDLRRIVGSHLWSRLSTLVLAGQSVVRFALHPHDFDVPSLRTEIRRALTSFMRTRQPIYYHELLGPVA